MAFKQWDIDSGHSGIHLSVRHMVVAKVRGQFSRWSGSLTAEDGDITNGTVKVVIDASSIDTGVEDRDAHLRSADFLDVANFPEITFEGKVVRKSSDDRLVIAGPLTLHGVSREVQLDVEYAGSTQDPWGNQRAGFSAKTSLDRKDFGLTWNQALEAGGVLVGHKVEIELEIEAVLQAEVKTA